VFKLKLARQLRVETTITTAWIARRLSMGTRGHLTRLLYKHAHGKISLSMENQPMLGM
jgi:hypothetical protein